MNMQPHTFTVLFSRIEKRFIPSGLTHDGTLSDTSSAVLPEPEEIQAYNGPGGSVEMVRLPGKWGLTEKTVLGAFAPTPCDKKGETDPSTLAAAFIGVYMSANRPNRAKLLDMKDPMSMSEAQFDLICARNASPTSKVVQVVSKTSPSVSSGVNRVTGRKRVSWNGHSGFALARWCGAKGWSGAEACAVFATIGMTEFGRSAILGGVYAGKKGERGDPAPVTPSQAEELERHRQAFSTKAAVVAAQTPPAPLAPPTPAQPIPTHKLSKVEKANARWDAANKRAKTKAAATKGTKRK